MLLGALLAYAVRIEHINGYLVKYRNFFVGISGMASLGIISTCYMKDYTQNVNTVVGGIGYTLFALFFAAVINKLINSRSNSIWLLTFDNRFMRLIGKHSYAMYIIHVPIIAFVYSSFFEGYAVSPWVPVKLFTIVFVLTFIGSWLIYHLFEKHFLLLKRFFVVSKTCSLPVSNATTVAVGYPAVTEPDVAL